MKKFVAAATGALVAAALMSGAAFAQAGQPSGNASSGKAPQTQSQSSSQQKPQSQQQSQKPAAQSGKTTQAKVVGVKDSLNVRSGPGTGNKVVGQLKPGQTVTVTGTSNGWSKISFGQGKTGWVSSAYLKTVR